MWAECWWAPVSVLSDAFSPEQRRAAGHSDNERAHTPRGAVTGAQRRGGTARIQMLWLAAEPPSIGWRLLFFLSRVCKHKCKNNTKKRPIKGCHFSTMSVTLWTRQRKRERGCQHFPRAEGGDTQLKARHWCERSLFNVRSRIKLSFFLPFHCYSTGATQEIRGSSQSLFVLAIKHKRWNQQIVWSHYQQIDTTQPALFPKIFSFFSCHTPIFCVLELKFFQAATPNQWNLKI